MVEIDASGGRGCRPLERWYDGSMAFGRRKPRRRDGIFFGIDEGGGRGGDGVESLITTNALNGGIPC